MKQAKWRYSCRSALPCAKNGDSGWVKNAKKNEKFQTKHFGPLKRALFPMKPLKTIQNILEISREGWEYSKQYNET